MAREETQKNFFRGLINRVEPQSIPRGAASDSLNFITKGDEIELSRGFAIMGSDAGIGRVAGLGKGIREDGTEVLFRTRARKIEYYSEDDEDWVEIGSNVLPADVLDDNGLGEDISIEFYQNLAGAFVYLSSPNSSIYKIHLANPDSITDLLSTAFRGRIKILQNRTLLWDQKGASGGRDTTGLYGSYVDKDETSDYTSVSAEAIAAAGSLTYTGTLAFKAAGSKRTCFEVTFTDGVETFIDDRNGALVGTAGGTGTINYTTGAYSVTFAVVAAGPVTSTYKWEDATSAGIADFSKSAPRTAGQGFVFRQDDGGGILQSVVGYEDLKYCLHQLKTWVVNITNTDTSATNLPFRDKVGLPYWRAAEATGKGIYYVDSMDEENPSIRLLTLNQNATKVVPISISDNIDLTNYSFDRAVVKEWGNFIVVACRRESSPANDRLLIHDRILGSWDIRDYYCSTLEVYNGALVAGDSVSNNVYILFSGIDDDDSIILGHWQGNLDNLDSDGLKKPKRLKIQGKIGPDQEVKILVSTDRGPFVEIGGTDNVAGTPGFILDGGHTYAIQGNGSYVDRSQAINVGAPTIGREEVGGGSDGIRAYNYEREFLTGLDRLENVMIRLEPQGTGYFSVSLYGFKDVRDKGRKIPSKYRS